jgi:ATP-dependent helicase/DNAse subunit B
MFYVKMALGLEPVGAPELGLDASQMGSMLHKILEQVYQTAANPADVDSLLAALPQVAGQVFASAPQKFGFRPSPLWEIEQAQFLAALELTLGALAEEGADWVPFAYEQTFGIRGTPVLSVELGSGETLRLHGVIDRIDRNARGELRVVDYKTGSSHLAQGDLKDGRRLQLPLYALAARDALGLGDVADGIYWKILAAEAGSLKLAKFRTDEAQGVDGAVQVAREHLLRIVIGIRAGDFPPVPPKGGCPSYCPAAQWCWRYEPGW